MAVRRCDVAHLRRHSGRVRVSFQPSHCCCRPRQCCPAGSHSRVNFAWGSDTMSRCRNRQRSSWILMGGKHWWACAEWEEESLGDPSSPYAAPSPPPQESLFSFSHLGSASLVQTQPHNIFLFCLASFPHDLSVRLTDTMWPRAVCSSAWVCDISLYKQITVHLLSVDDTWVVSGWGFYTQSSRYIPTHSFDKVCMSPIFRFSVSGYAPRDLLAAHQPVHGTLIPFCAGHCDVSLISPITEFAEHPVIYIPARCPLC